MKLLRCSRCQDAYYCSTKCQRSSWAKHKPVCGKAKPDPAAAGKDTVEEVTNSDVADKAVVPSPDYDIVPENKSIRFVSIADPDPEKTGGTCGLCGILMKKTGTEPDDMNKDQDPDGIFPIKCPERYDPKFPGCKPLPGAAMVPAPTVNSAGETVWSTSVLQFQDPSNEQRTFMGACINCARKVTGGTEAAAEGWMDCCELWMGQPSANKDLPDLNWFEQRMVALVALQTSPALDKGPESIAGFFSTPAGAGRTKLPNEGEPVAFNFEDIEPLAFPYLGKGGAEGYKGPSKAIFEPGTDLEQLREYTMMRFYSANPMWRSNYDFVMFSIHRLAAHGDEEFAAALPRLPQALDPTDPSFGDKIGPNSAKLSLKQY